MGTNRRLFAFLLAALFVLLLAGCDSKEYETRKAIVHQTKIIRSGLGYQLQIWYMFDYQEKTIMSDFKYPEVYDFPPRNRIINPGDSLVIEFPVWKPHKAKVKQYITMQE